MVFYPALGGAIFALSLLGAIILYSIMRKWYPVFYILAIALYIYTVGFVIDVFHLKRDFTFLLLLVSTGVMLLVGWYLNRRLRMDGKARRAAAPSAEPPANAPIDPPQTP